MNSRYAVKTALAGTCTAAIFMYLHYKNPQWAVMSTLLTMQSCRDTQSFESTLFAGFNRIAGAAVGILIGLVGYKAMNFVASDGFLWLILFVVLFTLWLAVIVNQRFQSLQLIPACTIMIVTMSLVNSATMVAYDRAFEVFSGVLVALVFNLLFCPFKQSKALSNRFQAFSQQCVAYVQNTLSTITEITASCDKPLQKDIKHSFKQLTESTSKHFKYLSDSSLQHKNQTLIQHAKQIMYITFHINTYTSRLTRSTLSATSADLIIQKYQIISALFQTIHSDSENKPIVEAIPKRYPEVDVTEVLLLHYLDELITTLYAI